MIFLCTLSLSEHTQLTVVKSSRILGFVMRNTQDFTLIKLLKVLYTTLIRSLLEYGLVIRNPFQAVYSTKLEFVQNMFLRYLNYKLSLQV